MNEKVKLESLQDLRKNVLDKYKKEWPNFSVGDTIKVHYKIKEGDKQRIQIYEGTVISIRGSELDKTMVVRRVAHNIGVERIFPFYSPFIDSIEVVRKGKVRRAKLFYLRDKSGKEGKIKESREEQAKMVAEKKAEKLRIKSEKVKSDAAAAEKLAQEAAVAASSTPAEATETPPAVS